jgi:hypothetical protein
MSEGRTRRSNGGPAAFQRWTPAEDQELKRAFAELSPRLMALGLGRSVVAILMRAIRIGAWKT